MGMTVKDLKEALKNLPDNMPIYVSRDGEGNSFAPLAAIDTSNFIMNDDPHDIEIGSEDWSASDAMMDEDEWAEKLQEPRILVFWP